MYLKKEQFINIMKTNLTLFLDKHDKHDRFLLDKHAEIMIKLVRSNNASFATK